MILGNKGSLGAHQWVKFIIQNLVLREHLGEKTPTFFLDGAFFSCVADEIVYQSAFFPRNFPHPLKFLVLYLKIRQKCIEKYKRRFG